MTPLEDLLQQCTVKIIIPGGWGTGFFVAPGLMLTCAHVVRKAVDWQVTVFYPAQQKTLLATVQAKADDGKTLDLALIELVEPLSDHPCVLLDEEPVAIGQALYSYGYLESYTNAAPVHLVNEGLTGDTPPLLKLQGAQIEKGISGAALLNLKTGKICGMVKETRAAGFDLGGGAIPTRVILEQFPQLRDLQREFHGQNPQWSRLVTGTIASSSPTPSKPPEIDFQPYLKAIVNHYDQQRDLYTPTDALLPLEARSVERQEGEDRQEKKVEQFLVLAGLRKYALGEKREHVLLAGRPGSGKSTALRQLALGLAEEAIQDPDLPIPVLVQLKADRSVPELIQAEFRRAKRRVTSEQIDDWLLNDRLILLLDGVNEVPTDNRRQALALFREDNLSVPIVFTTRDLAVGGDLGIGKRLEMKPLSPEQMKVFVGKYLPEHGEQLLRQLRDRLRELAETPLLLKMLCDVFDPETNQIPQNRGELFQWFDRDYRRIKKEIEYVSVSENFWEFKSEILQYLAFSMIQGEVPAADIQKPPEPWLTITKSRAEGILETWLNQRGILDAPTKAKLWLKELCNHHFLQDAAKPEEIEFHHQLFQEYYAAEYLLQQLPDLLRDESRFKRGYLNYLKWTEPVALMLALVDCEAKAVRVVQQALDVDLMLGARLVGEVRSDFQQQMIAKVLVKAEEKQVPEWLKIEILARTGSPRAVPELLDYLDNDDLIIATRAVSAIGIIGDNTAVPRLIQKLDTLEKWVENDELYVPSHLGTAQSGDKVLSHTAVKLESEIFKVCSLLSSEQITSKIIDHIEKPSSFIESFMKPEINTTFASCKQANVETKALQILESCNSLQSVNKLSQMATQLAKIKSQKAVSILTEKIKLDEGSQYLNAVIEALGEFDTEDAAQALAELLINFSSSIREKVTKILVKRQQKRAIPFLVPILDNQDFDTRWAAAYILGEFSEENALPVLTEGLTHENHRVRMIAAQVLGNLAPKLVIDLLLESLKDAAYSVRRNAAISLSMFERTEAIPELLKALKNYYPEDPLLSESEVTFCPPKNNPFSIKGFDTKSLSTLGNDDAIFDWLCDCPSSLIKEKIVNAISRFDTDVIRCALRSSLQQGNNIASVGLARLGEVDVAVNLIELINHSHLISNISAVSDLLVHILEIIESSNEPSIIPSIISCMEDIESHDDYYFRNRLAIVLMKIDCKYTYHYSSELWRLVHTDVGEQALWVIRTVQFNCKFYNYKIWQAHLAAQTADRTASQTSDRPITYEVNAEVVQIVENNYGTIHGKQTP